MAEGEEYNELGSEPISSLLCISRSAHKSWDFADNAEAYLETRVHKPVIKYDDRCAPYLKNLGLYQFSKIEPANIDPRLIMALVERWRPETHTFHLPVGETTVTLEDVSCLWGLPISGDVVIGDSDNELYDLIERCLGPGKANEVMYKKTLRGETIQVEFRIMLHLLRVNIEELPVIATEEEVARYTRAYIMDLFGSVLFPDSSGDSVPAMNLRFLENLYPERVPNWGAAALACLYRNLSNASTRKIKIISGPLLLLQHWSWCRFNIARPKLKGARESLGGPDEEDRSPYAIKWWKYKTYFDNPARGSMSFYRTKFEALRYDEVNWQPYHSDFGLLPGRVHRDRPYWLARVPLICFWIVAWHYPERVMRPFGLFQIIPPRAPHGYKQELKRLDAIAHTNNKGGDWRLTFDAYVQLWVTPQFIVENRPYNEAGYLQYRRWFQQNGMYTVYVRGQIESELDRPLHTPRDTVETLGYVPGGFRLSRMGQRGIQRVKWVIKNLYKRGTKGLAKTLLKSHHDDALDADTIHEFQHVRTEEGLPADVELLDDNEEAGTSTDVPPHCSEPPRHSMPEYGFYGPQPSFTQFRLGPSQPPVQYTGPSQPGGGHGYGYGPYGQFPMGSFMPSHPMGGYDYGGYGQFFPGAFRPSQPRGGFSQFATTPSGSQFATGVSGSQFVTGASGSQFTGGPNYDLGLSQPTQTSVNPNYGDAFLNLGPHGDVHVSTAASLWQDLTGTPAQPTVSTQIPFTPLHATEIVTTQHIRVGRVDVTPAAAEAESSMRRGKRKKKTRVPYTPTSPPSAQSANTA